jgi:AAA family ATPase
MRPGRLDRILYVDAPDQAARHEIFRIRFQVMAIEPNVDIVPLAEIVSSHNVITQSETLSKQADR